MQTITIEIEDGFIPKLIGFLEQFKEKATIVGNTIIDTESTAREKILLEKSLHDYKRNGTRNFSEITETYWEEKRKKLFSQK